MRALYRGSVAEDRAGIGEFTSLSREDVLRLRSLLEARGERRREMADEEEREAVLRRAADEEEHEAVDEEAVVEGLGDLADEELRELLRRSLLFSLRFELIEDRLLGDGGRNRVDY